MQNALTKLAHYLHQKGIRKGDRVCFICQNHHHFSTIILAAIKAGAVAVPLRGSLLPLSGRYFEKSRAKGFII
nr:AMP-binding protein [Bacillus pumilus]